tara:strand:+ start:372 stop:596 length:225 start_codon:yes stop_codon:yes gene_type:complete
MKFNILFEILSAELESSASSPSLEGDFDGQYDVNVLNWWAHKGKEKQREKGKPEGRKEMKSEGKHVFEEVMLTM